MVIQIRCPQLDYEVQDAQLVLPIILHRKKDGVEVKDSSDVKMEIFDRGGNTTARLTMTNVNQSRLAFNSILKQDQFIFSGLVFTSAKQQDYLL